MHVAQISFFTDPQSRDPAQIWRDWPSLADVAECAAKAGATVSVVQACAHTLKASRNGVTYHFLPFGRSGPMKGMGTQFPALLEQLAPDVLHVHGLGFERDISDLACLAPDTPILVQDHANRPPALWRRARFRRAISQVSAVAFCAREQSHPFFAAGIMPAHLKIFEIPESTTRFSPGDKLDARRELNVEGDPLVVWVGHLDKNKDPMTVLDGVSRASVNLPGLRLYCCYGASTLLKQMQNRIAGDSRLIGKVHLLGKLAPERVELLLRAADLFVSASHREGSGYSLIEALACGVTPVITDIPSFRTLTSQGSIGTLWPCGDPARLSECLQAAAARSPEKARADALHLFKAELSFEAVGAKLLTAYRQIANEGAAFTCTR